MVFVYLASLSASSLMAYRVVQIAALTTGGKSQYKVVRTKLGHWRRCKGDVFRRPPFAFILAICVGTGFQIIITLVVAVVLEFFSGRAALSFLPIVFGSFSLVAGVLTSKFYVIFHKASWF